MNTLNMSKSIAGPGRFLQVNVLKLEYGNLEYSAYIEVNWRASPYFNPVYLEVELFFPDRVNITSVITSHISAQDIIHIFQTSVTSKL